MRLGGMQWVLQMRRFPKRPALPYMLLVMLSEALVDSLEEPHLFIALFFSTSGCHPDENFLSFLFTQTHPQKCTLQCSRWAQQSL